MKIDVRQPYKEYCEVTFVDGGTTINTGFIGEQERRDLAAELISAAEDLLYGLDK